MEDADLAELEEPAEQAQFAAFAARVLFHGRSMHSAFSHPRLRRLRAPLHNAFVTPSLRVGNPFCLSRHHRFLRLPAFHAAHAVAPQGAGG